MRTCAMLAVTVCGLALLIEPLCGADWPAWRGPDRSGVSKETGLLKTWPKEGPNLVWQSNKAGRGYAGLAVVGGIVYTMGVRDTDEYALALDGKGNELWSSKIGPVHDWKTNQWSYGPNATPTVDGDRVYALSSKGVLLCANKNDGKEVWRLDLPKQLDAKVSNYAPGGIEGFGWGFCWSPLVDGDKLVIVPGGPQGLFAALDKNKGTVLWRSKGVTEEATYSSPIVATIGGVKQYIYLTQEKVVGVAAKDGELLWEWKRDQPFPDVVCPTPIVRGDRVYITVGDGGGCEGMQITPEGKKFKVTTLYSEKIIGNRLGGVVLVGDYVYGYHETRAWMCQDFNTGKLGAWPNRPGRLKSGAIIAADGRLYVLTEAPRGEPGTVAMLAASPKKYTVISQFKLPEASKQRKPSGNVWTHPVLSDGKLYLRDQELVFCYQVK